MGRGVSRGERGYGGLAWGYILRPRLGDAERLVIWGVGLDGIFGRCIERRLPVGIDSWCIAGR